MDSGLQLGTKISKTRIRMSCRTASLSVAFQGLSRPSAAVFSDPTDRPWVTLGHMMGHPRTPGMELICKLPRPHLLGRALIWPDHFVEAVSAIFVFFSSSLVKYAGFFPLAGKASLVSISRAVLFCTSLECLHWSSNFGEKVVLKRE